MHYTCPPGWIQRTNRQQTHFGTLDGQVASDNAVRLIDVFVDKLDLYQLGFLRFGSWQGEERRWSETQAAARKKY